MTDPSASARAGGGASAGSSAAGSSAVPSSAAPSSGAGSSAGGSPPAGGSPAAAPLRDEVRTGLITAAVLVLCGAPLGLLWSTVAPRPDLVRSGAGLSYADLETKDFIAADGLLFLLGAAAGIVAALVVWRLGRLRPVGALLGLVLGAGLASYVAWKAGVLVDDREALLAAAADPARTAPLDLPLELRSKAAVLGWPAAAALTFALVALRRPQALPE